MKNINIFIILIFLLCAAGVGGDIAEPSPTSTFEITAK